MAEKQAAPTLDPAIATWVRAAFGDKPTANFTKHLDYYKGIQNAQLTTRLRRILGGSDKNFNANHCEAVVDALVNRLEVLGFEVGAEGKAFSDWVNKLWDENQMDKAQVETHRTAAIKGEAFIVVDWNGERPRLSLNQPELIAPKYSQEDPDVMEMAAKQWKVGDRELLTLYYPDRIEKWESRNATAWEQRLIEGEVWPIDWTVDSKPIGVPIAHFRNKMDLSELDSILGLQDGLNRVLVAMVQTSDVLAYKQRYTVNAAMPAGGLKTYPGAIWQMNPENPEESVTIGQFDSEDPRQLIEVADWYSRKIASGTSTPQHLFKLDGNYPSGEALKTAESPLVEKAKNRQLVFGDSWEAAIRLARRVAAWADAKPPAEPDRLDTLWRNPVTRNEKEEIEIAGQKVAVLGIPQTQIWRELDYPEQDITQMIKEKEEQRKRDSNLGGELIKQFSGGAAV